MTIGELQSLTSAIASIAQIVGVPLVVLSLIYVARQVAQNTKAMQSAAQESAVSAMRDITKPLARDRELGDIFARGVEGWDRLDEHEQLRFCHLAFQFFKAAESVHYHHLTETLDDSVWTGWRSLLRIYLLAPGMQTYWNKRKNVFSPKFREWICSLDPESSDQTVFDLVEREAT